MTPQPHTIANNDGNLYPRSGAQSVQPTQQTTNTKTPASQNTDRTKGTEEISKAATPKEIKETKAQLEKILEEQLTRIQSETPYKDISTERENPSNTRGALSCLLHHLEGLIKITEKKDAATHDMGNLLNSTEKIIASIDRLIQKTQKKPSQDTDQV